MLVLRKNEARRRYPSKAWIVAFAFVALVIMSGCVYEVEEIVNHNDSLKEALSKCNLLCENKFAIGHSHGKILECTKKECECLCRT